MYQELKISKMSKIKAIKVQINIKFIINIQTHNTTEHINKTVGERNVKKKKVHT